VLAARAGIPFGFIHALKAVCLDEVQRAPEVSYDQGRPVDQRPTPGRFLLTGFGQCAVAAGRLPTL